MATQDQNQKNASDLGEQAAALAEQLGRVAGTLEGTAEAWLMRQKLADQLTRVRDGANQMLEGLSAGAERGRQAATNAASAVTKAANAATKAANRVGLKRGGAKAKTARPAAARVAQQADPAHAPGKRRRSPAPTMRGVKKSDERIPKLRTATAARQRRKSYA